LLEENMNDLEHFLSNDLRGEKLMQFYFMLGKSFTEYKDKLNKHTDRIDDKISWVNEIITAQQSYAGVSSVLQEVDLVNVIEDVLKVNSASLGKCNIEVIREYRSTPKALIQRVKLFHVLINILNNSKESILNASQENRKLLITLDQDLSGKYLRISDNGCGTPADTLDKLFDYEYSAPSGSQGFGLYSCANYMQEMGGRIWAESEGEGKGTAYILYFP
jgi:signal transduction histidine kinase